MKLNSTGPLAETIDDLEAGTMPLLLVAKYIKEYPEDYENFIDIRQYIEHQAAAIYLDNMLKALTKDGTDEAKVIDDLFFKFVRGDMKPDVVLEFSENEHTVKAMVFDTLLVRGSLKVKDDEVSEKDARKMLVNHRAMEFLKMGYEIFEQSVLEDFLTKKGKISLEDGVWEYIEWYREIAEKYNESDKEFPAFYEAYQQSLQDADDEENENRVRVFALISMLLCFSVFMEASAGDGWMKKIHLMLADKVE